MRGQAAVEYMLIAAAVFAIFGSITFAFMINPSQRGSDDTTRRAQVESACNAISNALNDVYSNAQGATKTVAVSMAGVWNISFVKNPPSLKMSISTSSGTENVYEDLRYSFDNSLTNIPSGNYTVIVEWWENKAEQVVKSGTKIYIRINPWKAS